MGQPRSSVCRPRRCQCFEGKVKSPTLAKEAKDGAPSGWGSTKIRVCPRIRGSLYSKIRIAAAIVVVHSDFLSPTADCVMFIVRTILFDIR